ncbi:MAG: hypothetical protein K0R67_3078 [Paenibacillus sp.]|nr:hypothetical protein [Paenibacillus sp.]
MDVRSEEHHSQQKANHSESSEKKLHENDHKEEYAAELAAVPGLMKRKELDFPENDRPDERSAAYEQSEEQAPSRTLGWLAMTLALLSLFLLPVWLGGGAIVLGIIAYTRGTKGLGAWSVIIGGISALSYIVLIPS